MFAVIGVDHEDAGNGDDNEKCCNGFAYSCQQLQPHSVFVLSLPCFLCLAKIILLKYDRVCIFQFLIYSLLMRSSIDPMSCGIIFCCQSFAVNVLFVTFLCRMSGLIM